MFSNSTLLFSTYSKTFDLKRIIFVNLWKHTLSKDNFSQEITSYEKSDWSSSNLDLLKRHGALLFFKENHMQYLILSEIVKAIFSIQPTSTAIESVYSGTGRLVTSDRHCLAPENVERLTILKNNRA